MTRKNETEYSNDHSFAMKYPEFGTKKYWNQIMSLKKLKRAWTYKLSLAVVLKQENMIS